MIKDLTNINVLNEMCEILVNHKVEKYDFYFKNDISWLLNNEKEIREDFDKLYNTNNIDFDILMNSYFIATFNDDYFWKSFKKLNNNFDLFATCISAYYFTFDTTNKDILDDIIEKYNTFKSFENDFEKIEYFKTIKRK